MTPAAQTALDGLRETTHFTWLIVPVAVGVLYLYTSTWAAGHRTRVLGGLAFLLADVFNELWNSAVFHVTGRAPVWGATGDSSYPVLIGWNVEIICMFAVLGLAAGALVPADPGRRVLGVAVRWWYVGLCSAGAVLVEVLLNAMGVLTWDWPWWSARFPVLIWLVGYCPFFAACLWIHELPSERRRVVAVVGIAAVDAALALVLALVGWL